MMLTLKAYLTASGSYPAREKHSELTSEYIEHANKLVGVINDFLSAIGWQGFITVSSGFRPSEVNAVTPGAAKKSLHTQCLAIDILDDKNQSLANLVKKHPELLKKYNLWLENPDNTKGKNTNWVHLDLGLRVDRPNRIFNP